LLEDLHRAPTSRFEDDKDPLPVFLVVRAACVQKDRATLPLAGPVAQWSEQRTHNPWDPGSNPGGPINRKPPGNGPFLLSSEATRDVRVATGGKTPPQLTHPGRQDLGPTLVLVSALNS
jgi:hypothetical protein